MLFVERLANETWRDCVKRIASKHGLETEALEAFDRYAPLYESEATAAFDALYDWDCCDISDD